MGLKMKFLKNALNRHNRGIPCAMSGICVGKPFVILVYTVRNGVFVHFFK
ncbi:hypothetical protein CLV32_1161 [Pedobacter duraquae]|uniref:Uncharacterized protein n=1 Tax=Pedobacter duraquae TaxID=425511 RepID=A0A4R6IRH8_9SPHI|nr:hypothetical protein CLV32_1161 [Pedobacter duraquae]